MFNMTLPSMGDFGTNAYLIWDSEKNGVIIDAPCSAPYIITEIDKQGIKLQKILLTHGHCDHIGAAAELSKHYDAPVYIHKSDQSKLFDSEGNVSAFFGLPPVTAPDKGSVRCFEDGDELTCGGLSCTVIHTPGHTSGSVCLLFEDAASGEQRLYTGDTLFCGSMGRTDMPDGDEKAMFASLALLWDKFENSDPLIFPGHGESSSMSSERRYNRYLKYAHNNK